MTLVVARITNGTARLIADMRAVQPEAAHVPRFDEGVLKLLVLQRNLCVGFAGDVSAALKAIREAASLGEPRDIREVVTILSRAGRSQSSDFIVAEPARIVRIIDGEAATASACWIGDQNAYEHYQRCFHAPGAHAATSHPELEEASRMSKAFDAVVDDSSILTVGEHAILVALGRDGFIYAPAARLSGGAPQTFLPGVATPIRLGSAAEGGFGTSIFSPRDGSPAPVVGIHFHQGQFGYLYHPLQREEPFLIRGSAEEFRTRIMADHQVDLDGVRIG